MFRDLNDLTPLLIREPFCPMKLSGLVSVTLWQLNFTAADFKAVSAGFLDSMNLKCLELVVCSLFYFERGYRLYVHSKISKQNKKN